VIGANQRSHVRAKMINRFQNDFRIDGRFCHCSGSMLDPPTPPPHEK
jgi:hypothetical protein